MTGPTIEQRKAATLRPPERPSGKQKWRDLLFLHWEVPVQLVRDLVPPKLDLDLFEGRAFVGLVPFAMFDVRPRWLPFGMSFLETNVRTYVHFRGEPGVYFFSLEAASWLAVQAARGLWSLPYHHADMQMQRRDQRVRYSSRRRRGGAFVDVDYGHDDQLTTSRPGTLDYYFLERYPLFVERGGRLWRGQVSHQPYPSAKATIHSLRESLLEAAGFRIEGLPPYVHYSPGVDVEVFGPHRVQDA